MKNFGLGVQGAEIATIISEFISMVLVLFLLLTVKEEYKVSLRKLKIDFSVLKK